MPEQSEHLDTQSTTQTRQNGDRQTVSGVEEEVPQKSGRKFIVIAVIILIVIGAAIFYWRSTFTEDTDDAQVDGDLYQVSSRVTGQVIKVYVDDNQQVKVGDPIAEIDPKDYQVAARAGPGQPRQRAGRRHSGRQSTCPSPASTSTPASTPPAPTS